MTVQGVAGGVFVAVGVLLITVAALGLLRLPDVYNRANAVTKAAGVGVVSVLLGVVVLAPSAGAVVTLLVAVALQLFTVPIAGYKIGEAAWLSGAPMVADPAAQDLLERSHPGHEGLPGRRHTSPRSGPATDRPGE